MPVEGVTAGEADGQHRPAHGFYDARQPDERVRK